MPPNLPASPIYLWTTLGNISPPLSRDALKAGTLHPFSGPLKDQTGKLVLAAGKTFTDPELKQMNFYVEGVEGAIPK